MRTQAETGVMWPKAKEHLEPPEVEEARKDFLLDLLERVPPC